MKKEHFGLSLGLVMVRNNSPRNSHFLNKSVPYQIQEMFAYLSL